MRATLEKKNYVGLRLCLGRGKGQAALLIREVCAKDKEVPLLLLMLLLQHVVDLAGFSKIESENEVELDLQTGPRGLRMHGIRSRQGHDVKQPWL